MYMWSINISCDKGKLPALDVLCVFYFYLGKTEKERGAEWIGATSLSLDFANFTRLFYSGRGETETDAHKCRHFFEL